MSLVALLRWQARAAVPVQQATMVHSSSNIIHSLRTNPMLDLHVLGKLATVAFCILLCRVLHALTAARHPLEVGATLLEHPDH